MMSYRAFGLERYAVAVMLVAVAAGCSTSTTSKPDTSTASATPASSSAATSTTTSSTAPLPKVSADRLDALLLTGAEAGTVMGPDVFAPRTEVFHELDSIRSAVPAECLGARWPAQKSVYEGSGYTAISVLELDPAAKTDTYIQQAVSTFPSQDEASAFIAKSAEAWRGCAGQNIVATATGADNRRWSFADVSGDPPKIAVVLTAEAGRGLACQHAMTAESNVVIDVNACGLDVTDQGSEIADIIADKVTR